MQSILSGYLWAVVRGASKGEKKERWRTGTLAGWIISSRKRVVNGAIWRITCFQKMNMQARGKSHAARLSASAHALTFVTGGMQITALDLNHTIHQSTARLLHNKVLRFST